MATLFIYGPPASGKSTLGRALAKALDWPFADIDEEIVKADGRPIPAIFAADGEKAFRALEDAALRRTVVSASGDLVVSLGGGTLLNPDNRAFAEAHGMVWCREAPSAEERARRIAAAAGSRPLGDMAEARRRHYATFGHRVAEAFYLPDSLVVVGSDLGGPAPFAKLVVADATAAARHADTLSGADVYAIPSGESHKTISTVCQIWEAMRRRGLGRSDRVAAFGGGVAGDLAGFAAATWMRGIAWANFPTTLLAMVDASTGGKTGCDLPEGKNLVGAFHSPRLVVVDRARLATLPPKILRDGRAEMIKHEIIAGLEPANPEGIPTAAEIARNLAVKVATVQADPFERLGRRILLNCGHTVAHALEIATNFALSHGEAVAIGCVEEARLAVRLGLANPAWPDELAARFAAAGLPTALPAGLDFASLAETMKGDKKRKGDTVTFALPCGNGDVRAVPVNLSRA